MSKTKEGSGLRDRAYTYTAGHDNSPAPRTGTTRQSPPAAAGRWDSRARHVVRRVVQRVAVLVALLILFYATSLHGVSARTLVLAVLLVLSLYWVFKGWL